MPKRIDIETILVVGAGPIIIGQACEFDYSGTQACRALKEEGYRVVLCNSNPATIMTDPDIADATYIEPITRDFLARIIAAERPQALLPTMGGQTALNAAMALHESGWLEKQGVELIGASPEAIAKAEDRGLFREAMTRIGLETPKARIAHTLEEAQAGLAEIGLPAIIRPSFTLGGLGGGIARTQEDFTRIASAGIAASPRSEILIEESVLGWKEYEMEVVRDKNDNCIIICSIENVDPMGVHTGDSITVAPALTLTDKEYQHMRSASIAVLREIGVETGGSNVQFAIDPKTGRMVVIEMNPRVSRSSALASKATGFPIAKVAARLAIGYSLDELANEITHGAMPASFEPTLDYVVTKIPRFAFEKFPAAAGHLTTSMQSVGEVMGIGGNFAESLQKALRGLETGLSGLDEMDWPDEEGAAQTLVQQPTPERLLYVAQALRAGKSEAWVAKASGMDAWFINQIAMLVQQEARLRADGLPQEAEALRRVKSLGFSDARLGHLCSMDEDAVRARRHALSVHPVFKRIDSCAAEFRATTAYMYSSYAGGSEPACEAAPTNKRKAMILGGGPNRIGQGIEFDYCCCHASFALEEAGIESIMVNCNPETVSTDYDISSRLYFEPLTVEDILEIVRVEQSAGEFLGAIVQLGGQTPINVATALTQNRVPILGTPASAVDLAEDRERFSALLKELDLAQPQAGTAHNLDEAKQVAKRIGYPVLLRPSYVLGGRGMEIVHDEKELTHYMGGALDAARGGAVLIDHYLRDAVEVDVDALGHKEGIKVVGVMEHIEEAGIHSGDSACVLPPHSLAPAMVEAIIAASEKLGKALGVRGLMNIQYAVVGDSLFVLEVNPRASRTLPFVAKATSQPIVRHAVQAMLGEPVAMPDFTGAGRVAVKEAVFPFSRFPAVDVLLGPEMRSTGEVMGVGADFASAFAKSQLAAGGVLPDKGCAFLSVKERDKAFFAPLARHLAELGFDLLATHGTAAYLAQEGIEAKPINKVQQGSPHIVEALLDGSVDLVLNTTEGAKSVADSRSLRQAAVRGNIPYYTTRAGAAAAVQAIALLRQASLPLFRLQDQHFLPQTK